MGEGWWDATAQALREVVDAVGADRVAGVCITHQRESYAPVDAENRSLRNAIPWDDGRAGAQLAELGERFGHDELHRRTGRGPSLTQAFPKLLWLVQNEPRSPSARTASWTPTATSCSVCRRVDDEPRVGRLVRPHRRRARRVGRGPHHRHRPAPGAVPRDGRARDGHRRGHGVRRRGVRRACGDAGRRRPRRRPGRVPRRRRDVARPRVDQPRHRGHRRPGQPRVRLRPLVSHDVRRGAGHVPPRGVPARRHGDDDVVPARAGRHLEAKADVDAYETAARRSRRAATGSSSSRTSTAS